MARTIQIVGSLLGADRDEAGLTCEALLARVEGLNGPTIALSTLRRAEKGKVSARNLRWFAEALGFPPERYRASDPLAPKQPTDLPQFGRLGWTPTFDLSGNWRVYYIEDDVEAAPYVCVERLTITQEGGRVSGIYRPERTDHPDGYVGVDAFRMDGLTGGKIVLGHYYRENVADTQGAGVFNLQIGRGGVWAEGACSFHGDDGKLMVSMNLWIREDSSQFRIMEKQAKALFQKHMLLWKLPI